MQDSLLSQALRMRSICSFLTSLVRMSMRTVRAQRVAMQNIKAGRATNTRCSSMLQGSKQEAFAWHQSGQRESGSQVRARLGWCKKPIAPFEIGTRREAPVLDDRPMARTAPRHLAPIEEVLRTAPGSFT